MVHSPLIDSLLIEFLRVRENLGTLIQTAGSSGHSSVEDAVATLDLVRWHLLNKPKPKTKPPVKVGIS